MGVRYPGADVLLDLIREQRKASLRARTIQVTLASALRDLEVARDRLAAGEAIDLRRRWCSVAEALLLDVRAETLRTRAIGLKLAEALTEMPHEMVDLATASDEADEAVDLAERVVREGLVAAG
jgi:hypothetical protein